MKVRRKSLWRSKNIMRRFRMRTNQRAAKERKRLERINQNESVPDLSNTFIPKLKPSGFRITVQCLDDGERVSFTSFRNPWGDLTISPTLAGQKVACVLSNYQAVKKNRLDVFAQI